MKPAAIRNAARLFAALALAWSGLVCAQTSAKDINAPFVTNPDVLRWRSVLENEDREVYAKRNEILAATGVKPGMAVADVGSGTGLFTRMFAQAVTPGGRVYAVDISQPLLDHVMQTAKAQGLDNVTAVLDSATDVNLPEASVDLVYLCDTYHHFESPQEVLASIKKALKPGGRLVVIDFERIPGVTPARVLHHVRVGKREAIKEIEAAGFRFTEDKKILRENWFAVFQRP